MTNTPRPRAAIGFLTNYPDNDFSAQVWLGVFDRGREADINVLCAPGVIITGRHHRHTGFECHDSGVLRGALRPPAGGRRGHAEGDERYLAYCDTLAEYGLPVNPALVVPGHYYDTAAQVMRPI